MLNSEGRIGISTAAMANCHRLQRVENSQTITSIGKKAFQNCFHLENVEFGASLQKIGEAAFENCHSITEISLPDSVKILEKIRVFGVSRSKKRYNREGLYRHFAGNFPQLRIAFGSKFTRHSKRNSSRRIQKLSHVNATEPSQRNQKDRKTGVFGVQQAQ